MLSMLKGEITERGGKVSSCCLNGKAKLRYNVPQTLTAKKFSDVDILLLSKRSNFFVVNIPNILTN